MVTGEWFLEERSKRFEQGVASSDVIKQTILNSPASESHRCLLKSKTLQPEPRLCTLTLSLDS